MTTRALTKGKSVGTKKCKWKNFCVKEEWQSSLAMFSSCLSRSNNKIWSTITHILRTYIGTLFQKQVTRWKGLKCSKFTNEMGIIKHNVREFVSCYNCMLALNEFGTLLEDVLQWTLKLYKLNTPKVHHLLTFITGCLKNISKWDDEITLLNR